MSWEPTGDQDRRAGAESVRFGFYLVEPVGLHAALRLGVRAEEWGFDLVALCENLFWWNPGQAPVWDNFTVLATLAERTSRIPLMTNVIDPVKRHPAVVAHMVSTLDNLSPGRIILGIGAGERGNFGPLVDVAGPPPHRLFTRTREFIEVLRGVWSSTAESPFSFEGTYFRLENAHLSLKPVIKPHPPIYLAAMGPRTRQLTGRVADGWTPVAYTPETYASDWEEVAAAAKSAGRKPDAIDRALTISTLVLRDGKKAREIGGGLIGRIMLANRPRLLRQLGHPELADDRLDVSRTANPMDGVQVAERIPLELGERVTICGTPGEAIRRIEEFVDAGVRLFVLWPPYEDEGILTETLDHYRNSILPHFAHERHR
jgi:alkanesulfonate monooxygenase SsuD/methylene tetrahydromethanopterin reductase-like flavin-dependent oxidoreductase (luciferase family)